MNPTLLSLLSLILVTSCIKNKASMVVFNGNIYTVNKQFDKVEALAVKDGKIIKVGTSKEILDLYGDAQTLVDLQGKTVVPGLIDAHCHFHGLGLQQQKVDLTGTKSYDEVLQRLEEFQKEKNTSYITGRGWDQNDWKVKEFPTKERLDKLFPNTPVAIRRIDGHALLVNQAAIDLANVTTETPVFGGEILQKDGKLTGIFIDAPMQLISRTIPSPSRQEEIQALMDAEEICLSYGLTTVDDAGLSRSTIELIDSLHKAGMLKMRVYAMVSATDQNIEYYTKHGIIKTDRLNVRSFKAYSDGALGSRGAALKSPYSDHPSHHGALVRPIKDLQGIAEKIAHSDYQLNTHAIGDSANKLMLDIYKDVLNGEHNRRWRIEHAQIISPEDFDYFDDIIPSVQPTHATSDMYWAEDRLGVERMKGAYAFKDLLDVSGRVALGTDFPVEQVSSLLTFYASVARKDLNQYPEGGFQPSNALSREETLRGMTIWAAYANFEEEEKGSLEVGKVADFCVLSGDIMTVDESKIPYLEVEQTYINGEKLYEKSN